jgi:hypothetical protein
VTPSVSRLRVYNAECKVTDGELTGKDLEEGSRGLSDVLSRHLPGETEEKHVSG